jgi:hypothetical protein
VAEYRAIFGGARADLRLLGARQMKVVSERCEQARWKYNGVVSEVKKEIPDYLWCRLPNAEIEGAESYCRSTTAALSLGRPSDLTLPSQDDDSRMTVSEMTEFQVATGKIDPWWGIRRELAYLFSRQSIGTFGQTLENVTAP